MGIAGTRKTPIPRARFAIRKEGGLGRSALIGTSWLLAQNIGTRAISFASQIILAKLLAPGDFGNIGLALTVTTLASAVANFGVDDVLLQRQKTLHFWSKPPAFITSLGLGVLSFFRRPGGRAARCRDVSRAGPAVASAPYGGFRCPLTGLSTVPTAKIRADLNFRFLAAYTTFELAALQLLTIALALLGAGVYSFAIPAPIMAGVRAAVFWIVAKPRLGPLRSKQLRMMGSNSAAVFGTKILTAAVSQGDYFVLGLLAPKPVVGAYFFAFRLAIQPVQMLAGNLSNVLFPVLAQLQNDPERQRQAAMNASRILAFAVMPYCFLQAAVARPLLDLVFGAKWQAAILLVEILSIGLAFDAVSWVAGALLQARGEFRRSFNYACFFFPIFFRDGHAWRVSVPGRWRCGRGQHLLWLLCAGLFLLGIPPDGSILAGCGGNLSIAGRIGGRSDGFGGLSGQASSLGGPGKSYHHPRPWRRPVSLPGANVCQTGLSPADRPSRRVAAAPHARPGCDRTHIAGRADFWAVSLQTSSRKRYFSLRAPFFAPSCGSPPAPCSCGYGTVRNAHTASSASTVCRVARTHRNASSRLTPGRSPMPLSRAADIFRNSSASSAPAGIGDMA